MIDRLLVATRNEGKLRELSRLLAESLPFFHVQEKLPVTLLYLADVGIEEEVEETGSTLEENAVLKATTYARLSGLPTLADDSGLEVDALDGEPARSPPGTRGRARGTRSGLPSSSASCKYTRGAVDGPLPLRHRGQPPRRPVELYAGECRGPAGPGASGLQRFRIRPHLPAARDGEDDGGADGRGEGPGQPQGRGGAQGGSGAFLHCRRGEGKTPISIFPRGRGKRGTGKKKMVVDEFGRPLRDLRNIGHRPVQFPVPILHAGGDIWGAVPVPAKGAASHLRGDRAAHPDHRAARGRQGQDHRRRAAGPQRRRAAGGDAGRRRRGRGPYDDDERLPAAAEGGGAEGRRGCSG